MNNIFYFLTLCIASSTCINGLTETATCLTLSVKFFKSGVSKIFMYIGLRLGFAGIVNAYGQVLNGASDKGTIPVAHYY